jgi:hypothetical protein
LFDNPPAIRSAIARSRGVNIFDHSFSDSNMESIPATALYSIAIETIGFVLVTGCRTTSKDTGVICAHHPNRKITAMAATGRRPGLCLPGAMFAVWHAYFLTM